MKILVSVVRFRPWAPFKDILNIQPLERPLKSQMAYKFQEGVMHKQSHQNTHPTFTYRKGRIFYFRRKIPSDLRCHYKRPVFVQSLRTTSRSSAQKAATILSARLDEQWLMLRIKHNQSPASQLLVEAEHKSELPLISEILDRYLDTKGQRKAQLCRVLLCRVSGQGYLSCH